MALTRPGSGHSLCFVTLPRGQAMLRASGLLRTDQPFFHYRSSPSGRGAAREGGGGETVASYRKGAKAHTDVQRRGSWAGSGEAGQVRP